MQIWDYEDCQVIDYKSFLEDSLVNRKFTKRFDSEIHDRIIFECDGFSIKPSQVEPKIVPERPFDYVDFTPSDDNRAQRFVLTLSGGELTESQSYFTFAKFEPLMEEKGEQTPARHQLSSPGFVMESLPSKDKESYYELLQRYVNPGIAPEPFDATIELVAGDGDVLQTWEYRKCGLTDFDYYLQDNLLYFTS